MAVTRREDTTLGTVCFKNYFSWFLILVFNLHDDYIDPIGSQLIGFIDHSISL